MNIEHLIFGKPDHKPSTAFHVTCQVLLALAALIVLVTSLMAWRMDMGSSSPSSLSQNTTK